jgi:hypothetical protein
MQSWTGTNRMCVRKQIVCSAIKTYDTQYSVAHADAPERGHAHMTSGMKSARSKVDLEFLV